MTGSQAKTGARTETSDGLVSGQRIVVIGGADGLGSAVVDSLSRAGAELAIVDRNEAAASTLAADIVSRGGTAVAIGCDVRQVDVMDRVVQEAVAALG